MKSGYSKKREGVSLDFKTQVISGAQQQYQDMLSGKTEPPVRPDLGIDSSSAYSAKRQKFVQRLEKERKEFNNAIVAVKKARDARLKGENDYRKQLLIDRSNFGGVIATTIIFAILVAALVFCFIKFDLLTWANVSLLPATGENFASLLDMENTTIALVISAIIAAIVGIIMFFVSFSERGLIASAIIAYLCTILAFILSRLVVFLVGYALYYLFQPWGVLVLAGIACILNLIFGRDLLTRKYKGIKWILCLVCLVIGFAAMMIVKM